MEGEEPNWVSSLWVSDVVRRCRRYLRAWAPWYELRVCRITRERPRSGHGGPARPEITDHLYTGIASVQESIRRLPPFYLLYTRSIEDYQRPRSNQTFLAARYRRFSPDSRIRSVLFNRSMKITAVREDKIKITVVRWLNYSWLR